jgi:Tol biopolymer transport system component
VGGDAWVADIASGTLSRITTDSSITTPEWSADGQSLIVARLPRAGGKPGLDRIPATGGAATRLLTRTRPVFESQWSSDGRTVIWREDTPGTGRDIYTMRDGDTTSIRALHATAFDERGLAMAPDGNWYAFVSDESGRDEVYVARLDQPGPRWPVTSAGGIEPRWAKNGELFYRLRDSVYVTRVTPADAAPSIALPRAIVGGAYVTQGFEPRWDVSPDGQRFAMVRLPSRGASLQLSIHLGWLAALENGTIP